MFLATHIGLTLSYIQTPVFVGKDTGCDWLARTYDSDLGNSLTSVIVGAVTKQSSTEIVNDCVAAFVPVLV